MTPESFIERTLRRYERPLVSYARAITGDLDSARDAVQETFLRLSRQNLEEIEPRVAPWLFFVCRNCALDHCRKIARFSAEPVDDDAPDHGPSPAESASAQEDAARLRHLIQRLPERQRELVSLKFDAGLSYREISEATRLSVSNVGVQLHNAIQTLRTLWNRDPLKDAESLPLS
ncbi:MAG TPA: sigma-70 family RNA polymerase sigma factor [Chthoniobacterales bacterium]|jgi:RNA polymerase sigma-70 factor (ECF subfamily)